jgi:hypothetical protein
MLESTLNTVSAIEFQRISPSGRIQATSTQVLTLSTDNYLPIRVLSQEKHEVAFRVGREPPTPGKKVPLYWIFEINFIKDLPWDPGEWHWQGSPLMGDALFFSYSAKRGYKNTKRAAHTPSIHSFIQRLNLQNSTISQVIVRIGTIPALRRWARSFG